QCGRSSRSLPIAAMYSHASPIVLSVPPSFVGIGEVSFLVRYVGLNMARKTQSIRQPLFFSPHLPSRRTATQPMQFCILSQSVERRSVSRRAGARSHVSED